MFRFRTYFHVLILLSLLTGFLPPATLRAQTYSGITSPVSGAYLSGLVTIAGTADLDRFWKYELAYKAEPSDADAFAFLLLAEKPVVNGMLGLWDTSDLSPGIYTLRLRVVTNDGNYLEFYAENLHVNLPRPPVFVSPLPTPIPQVAQQSQPPRGLQLNELKGKVVLDRLLPSPNYATDHTLYAIGEGKLLRSLDEGVNWEFADELEGAPIDWSQAPLALATTASNQVELELATPSLLSNPFSARPNPARTTLVEASFAPESPYFAQGNLLRIDPSTLTWRGIDIPSWFSNENWLLSYSQYGELWATRLKSNETITLLTREYLQSLLGVSSLLLQRAIPSPTGEAVALVVDSQIVDDPEQAVGLQLLVLSLRDGNLRLVAPLQESNTKRQFADPETYVASRNMAVSLGSVAWAHDGKQFAFASAFGSTSVDLYRFELQTTRILRLSDEPDSVEGIHWSLDDSILLYTVRHRQFEAISNSSADLYAANADGSGYRRLYNDNSFNTKVLDWIGPKSALIYSQNRQADCSLQNIRKLTIANQAEVGQTVTVTQTQIFTDTATGITTTQEIQVPVLVTTTQKLVPTEILTLTTEPFQTLGYAPTRQEFLLTDGRNCGGVNPPGLYRLRLDNQPPQRIADPLFTTRLQPLPDGRWLLQNETDPPTFLGIDNTLQPIAPFTDTLTSGEVVTLELSSIADNQWLWRLPNDPQSQFWLAEVGSTPQRYQSPLINNTLVSVANQTLLLAGVNSDGQVVVARYPSAQVNNIIETNQISTLQLVEPVRARVSFERAFPKERWSIQRLPQTDAPIVQILPSPNYAIDQTIYLRGEREIYRSTNRGQSWSRLLSDQIDGLPAVWLSATTMRQSADSHLLLLASGRGELLWIDPVRQRWQSVAPLPQWLQDEDWQLVTNADTLWALRSDGNELVKLTTVPGVTVNDPNPQDTVPAPSPFASPLRSPDGKWLAFTADANFTISLSPIPVLYLLSLQDGSLRVLAPLRLPYNAAALTGPDDVRTSLNTPGLLWSSDSRKLAFVREQVDSQTDLFVHDVASNTTTRLSNEPGYAYQLRWSPDDKFVAFTSAYSFGSGESYAMAGVWVADVNAGVTNALYSLPSASTGEQFVGWLNPHTLLTNSTHPLCGTLYLRGANLLSNTVSSLVPTTFGQIEFNPARQSALTIALPSRPECQALFIALTNPGIVSPTNGITVPIDLSQTSVISPGIYHSYITDTEELVTERVGGDLAGIDEGQTAGEFATLKATLIDDPNPPPNQATVAPVVNLAWSNATYFDNGLNSTVQLGDAQGQQLTVQTDTSVKQLLSSSDGQNVFVVSGNATLSLQRLRYPVPRLESSSLISNPLGILSVRSSALAANQVVTTTIQPLVQQNLQIGARATLPPLDGRLLTLLPAPATDLTNSIYLASEQSLWRSTNGGKSWQVTSFAKPVQHDSLEMRLTSVGLAESPSGRLLSLSIAAGAEGGQLQRTDLASAIWNSSLTIDSWLVTQPWQLLVLSDTLWASLGAGEPLLQLTPSITNSEVLSSGLQTYYQITPSPNQQQIAWLSLTAPPDPNTQTISPTLQ
ncbi:MAG: hypothetical protein U0175_35815, partial [Caldilineaceae bacterium]